MDGITVIEQTTAEREQEVVDLWNQIKPLLDQGMTYSKAVKKVKGISSNISRHNLAWYRDVVEYGEKEGYLFDDYNGKRKVK